MKTAILSGKGGTGKTFVSVNLSAMFDKCCYVDCDVEEPNGRLFLQPENVKTQTVNTEIPMFDADACNGCRACVDFCKFNALAFIKNKPRLFTEICHNCGGCALVCKAGAVSECKREVGKLEIGNCGNIKVLTGILNLGEASAVPVIKAAQKNIPKEAENVIIDCPPGSSCSVMESIADADFCLIVTEGTAFGFQNFMSVYRLAKLMGKKVGTVVNKYEYEYAPLNEFCKRENIPILLKIPFKKEVSLLVSKGKIASRENSEYRELFTCLARKLEGRI